MGHVRRERFGESEPLHVTLRVVAGVRSLRREAVVEVARRAIERAVVRRVERAGADGCGVAVVGETTSAADGEGADVVVVGWMEEDGAAVGG